MNSFEHDLAERLTALRDQNLFRELRQVDSAQSARIQIAGKAFLNFSSNDYLGLATHPALIEAAIRAVDTFGAGSGASRLICGSLKPFHELETELARLKKTEAAIAFSSGYAAAQGAIGALIGKDDIIILDKLVHACIVDAAKLSGAKIRVFRHNDVGDLEEKLQWASQNTMPRIVRRVLIVTESIFSMDGDIAPLREIVKLKDKYHAWLMVDEAHATGIFGENGGGLIGELGLTDRVELQMATLGKALGASGGCICGSRRLVDFMVNRARPFIFSTAPAPAAAAAATAAIRLVQSAEGKELRKKLQANISEFQSDPGINPARSPALQYQSKSGPTASGTSRLSPIQPIIVGDEQRALDAAAKLRERQLFVPAIRYPSVARGSARLRITFTAAHSREDIFCLVDALKSLDIRD
ncbi:MAG TPA: 8-amino-7-oxononanoate synthase [Verrucomicrobiae bacterium]|nr:8-amino-7-oxononanoate synthase [Verrucomicrobiae bacterium]